MNLIGMPPEPAPLSIPSRRLGPALLATPLWVLGRYCFCNLTYISILLTARRAAQNPNDGAGDQISVTR